MCYNSKILPCLEDDNDDDEHVSYELGVGVTVIRSRGTSREKVTESGGDMRGSEGQAGLFVSYLFQANYFPRGIWHKQQNMKHETEEGNRGGKLVIIFRMTSLTLLTETEIHILQATYRNRLWHTRLGAERRQK